MTSCRRFSVLFVCLGAVFSMPSKYKSDSYSGGYAVSQPYLPNNNEYGYSSFAEVAPQPHVDVVIERSLPTIVDLCDPCAAEVPVAQEATLDIIMPAPFPQRTRKIDVDIETSVSSSRSVNPFPVLSSWVS